MSTATPAVRYEWARRVAAEYHSAAITHHLALWLIQLGVPRELIDDALRIVKDELDHSELSARVLREAGESEPVSLRQQLALPRTESEPLVRDVLRATVRAFCIGETVAVPLFKELRSQCNVPIARDALDRVLKDEVRHRQFGWDLLDYLLQAHPELAPSAVADFSRFVDAYVQLYPDVPTAGDDPIERAWGMMPAHLYRRILLETIDGEYIPRASQLGIRLQLDSGKC